MITETTDKEWERLEQFNQTLEKEKEDLQKEKEDLQKEKENMQKEKEDMQKEKEDMQKEKVKLEKKLGMKLFNTTVKKMFDDENFVKKLDEKLLDLTRDGKIDSKDVPDLMLIVLEITDNLSKFNLTYEEILKVLEEFIIYILETKNLIQEKDKDEIFRLVNTVIKLTMARPQVSKWFKKLWTNIRSKLCCCSS
jgi:ATP-dependent 26S proteasome regulatory subunit